MAIQKPSENDGLIKLVNSYQEVKDVDGKPVNITDQVSDFKDESNYRQKFLMKIKSRLFVPKCQSVGVGKTAQHNLSEWVRCNDCNATLLQEIAV